MTSAAPDFSIIKFVEHKTNNCVDLGKFFDTVLKREALEIGLDELGQILCKELNINISELDGTLKLMLPESLVYYMTVWPGWQRFEEYNSGQLSRQDWFERFQQYLILKSHFVIKTATSLAKIERAHIKTDAKDAATQTDMNNSDEKIKPFAPYGLCIAGPAPVLNNIVFVKSQEDILIKQYPEKPWQCLRLVELYNWPNISIDLNLPDISLSRTMAPQVERYISLSGDKLVVPETNHVSYVKKVLEGEVRISYSHEFLSSYFRQLNGMLRTIPKIGYERMIELQRLLTEFLQDVSEVNLYQKTMCTNMTVGYNIGQTKYIRSRKMVTPKYSNESKDVINFYEILTPHVEFTLRSFHALQDMNDKAKVSFKGLNELEQKMAADEKEAEYFIFLIHHCLSYKCTACNQSFSGRSAKNLITKHFTQMHKGEQSVLCDKCHQEFTIQWLAGKRWKHFCTTKC